MSVVVVRANWRGKDSRARRTFFLLNVGRDVDQGGGPFGAVLQGKLLENDLCGLPVGRVLREQDQAFGVLDIVRGGGDEEILFGRHNGVMGGWLVLDDRLVKRRGRDGVVKKVYEIGALEEAAEGQRACGKGSTDR